MPRQSIYIGIDPGFSQGGISVIKGGGVSTLSFSKSTERDILDFLSGFPSSQYVCKVVIEKVASMPGQGVASTFKFGQGYGFLRGLLTALKLPYIEVMPKVWQAKFIPVTKKLEKAERKRMLKGVAQRLFPAPVITLENADSILLAYYAKHHYMAKPTKESNYG